MQTGHRRLLWAWYRSLPVSRFRSFELNTRPLPLGKGWTTFDVLPLLTIWRRRITLVHVDRHRSPIIRGAEREQIAHSSGRNSGAWSTAVLPLALPN